VLTIFGNRVSPLLAEIYLARTAYGSQQTTEAEPGVRAGNLFEPVPGDPGAHGQFDARSHDHSIQLAWTKHRVAAGVGALAAGAAAGAARIAVPRLARR
jgi:hypothetical protein